MNRIFTFNTYIYDTPTQNTHTSTYLLYSTLMGFCINYMQLKGCKYIYVL